MAHLWRSTTQVSPLPLLPLTQVGTEVIFKPGSIYGGELEFDCGEERSLVYFLEALLILAPFSKFAFRVTLDGITADGVDQTIDGVKNVNLQILKLFGVDDGVDFKILRRGASPLGGGRISFTCPVVAALKPVNLVEVGQVRKIRGVAATTRVSPQVANRMIEAARGQLNTFIPDVYIYSDVFKGEEAGRSSGYSLFLQAETTTGAVVSADGVGQAEQPVEDMALYVTRQLLKQIQRPGMVDQSHQWMLIILMALCPEDLSKAVLGPISPHAQVLLEDIKVFLGVTFKARQDFPKRDFTTLSCIGAGFGNVNRRAQ
jgi:RNA 3'-terminal phosphate cyclase-like protein